jgi:cobalt-precorrin 5A hydrolase/precorrin-3B C17-methyltransferase
MKVLAISLTESGRALAATLPYRHVHGAMGDTVRAHWAEGDVDGFVLFAATGAAVRIVGPLLADKATDPAVVTVDEAGRFVVALVGGHAGGANQLARTVATLLGAEAVVTTATDSVGLASLDTLPGHPAEGELAAVSAAMVNGRRPRVENGRGWPLPPEWLEPGDGPERVVVSDELADPRADGDADLVPTVWVRPPSLVVGVGSATVVDEGEMAGLVSTALAEAGLSPQSVALVATIDRRRDHPAVASLGLPVVSYSAETLAQVAVPTPSQVVASAVGTPSVSEAAALLAAGPGGELVVTKTRSANATMAVARRARPEGLVTLVGLGPGSPLHRTPAAERAVRRADTVIGYSAYVDQCADLLSVGQQVIRSPLGSEVDRARQALELAATGRSVAMVCSGDAGVYAMASPVFELTTEPALAAVKVAVVPGVTAGLATAAVLGAPLGHDHVLISLSDLLTPWERIEARVVAAAQSDLVVVLYNPRSERRIWQLDKAIGILVAARPATTPVGVVTDAGRDGQQAVVTDLAHFDATIVTMTSCVIVGATSTLALNGRMVTPRGYTT